MKSILGLVIFSSAIVISGCAVDPMEAQEESAPELAEASESESEINNPVGLVVTGYYDGKYHWYIYNHSGSHARRLVVFTNGGVGDCHGIAAGGYYHHSTVQEPYYLAAC